MSDYVEGINMQVEPYKKGTDLFAERKPFAGLQSGWEVHQAGIAANQAKPSDHKECRTPRQHERMRWCIVLDANTSGCRLNIGRWIAAKVKKDVYVDVFHVDETREVTGLTIVEQDMAGDMVGAYVTDITRLDDGVDSDITVLFSRSARSAV